MKTHPLKTLCSALVVTFIATCTSTASAQLKPQHPWARLINIDVVVGKPAKIQGGDWDDKQQRVKLRVKVSSVGVRTPLGQLSATVLVLGDSAIQTGITKVLSREQAKVDLSTQTSFEHAMKEVQTSFDKTGVKHGFSYGGWVVVLTDEKGALVTCKATSALLQSNPDKVLALGEGTCFDRKLTTRAEPSR